MTKHSKRNPLYAPAEGSEAVVCWIVIAAGVVIGLLSSTAWLVYPADRFPFLELLLSLLGVLGAVARLRGWAPAPKGI